MAGPMDFFMPQGVQPQLPMADPNQPGMLASLQDPGLQGALLQAGLSLMGGRNWGDTGASQVARAIGSAGEQGGRVEAANLKEREVSSKEDLRAAQAEAAGARAGQAGTNADLARARLGIAEAETERKRSGAFTQGKIRLSNMYQQHLRDVAKENANRSLMGQPPVNVPTMKDWIAGNPMLKGMGLIPDEEAAALGDEGTVAPAGASGTTPTVYPTATPGMQKEAGKTYQTPRGPLKWTGTAWTSP